MSALTPQNFSKSYQSIIAQTSSILTRSPPQQEHRLCFGFKVAKSLVQPHKCEEHSPHLLAAHTTHWQIQNNIKVIFHIPDLKVLLKTAPGLEMSQTFRLQPKTWRLPGRAFGESYRRWMLLESANSPLTLQSVPEWHHHQIRGSLLYNIPLLLVLS